MSEQYDKMCALKRESQLFILIHEATRLNEEVQEGSATQLHHYCTTLHYTPSHSCLIMHYIFYAFKSLTLTTNAFMQKIPAGF
jgi:hypothetical protein